MKQEITIYLTPQEIEMTQSFCKDIIILKPKNVNLISSVLTKLDNLESIDHTLRQTPTKKKRGRPQKVISTTPEPLEVVPEIITSLEEPKLTGKKRGRPRKEVSLSSKHDHEETPVLSDFIEEPKPIRKKRGRPKRVFKSEEQKEVSSKIEPEILKIKEVPSKIETEPVTIVVEEVPLKTEPEPKESHEKTDLVEEHEPEHQPIPSSDSTEKGEAETDQTTNVELEKPKLTRFQAFLKKLRI